MQSNTNIRNNTLLAAGALAGPFFILVYIIQDATRPGFHPLQCQVSHLALGDFGWVQAINFFVTGALVLAFAVGLRQALRPHMLIPSLFVLIGIGLIAATFFATVPGYGCPSGIPSVPTGVTINGPAHDAAAGLVWICLAVAGIVCGRRSFQQGQHLFAIYSILSVVAMLVFLSISSIGFAQTPGLVDVGGLFERLAIMSMFVWMTTLAVYLLRGKKLYAK